MATDCLKVCTRDLTKSIGKPRFETERFVLNWDFHILIILSLDLSKKQDQDWTDRTALKQKI